MNQILRNELLSLIICGVHLPCYEIHPRPNKLYTLICRNGIVESIVEDLRIPNKPKPDSSITKVDLLHTVDAGGKGILIPS